jgi:hypothetical protein
MVLHQHVPKMCQLSYGWTHGIQYAEWLDVDNLTEMIPIWLSDYQAKERAFIAANAQAHVLKHHTWDERVRVLVEELLPQIEGVRSA